MIRRPRRLRRTPQLRRMVRETRLSPDALILPFFIREGTGVREEIASMPGQCRYSPDTLPGGMEKAVADGVNSFLLFGLPDRKDETGSAAWDEHGDIWRVYLLSRCRKEVGSREHK